MLHRDICQHGGEENGGEGSIPQPFADLPRPIQSVSRSFILRHDQVVETRPYRIHCGRSRPTRNKGERVGVPPGLLQFDGRAESRELTTHELLELGQSARFDSREVHGGAARSNHRRSRAERRLGREIALILRQKKAALTRFHVQQRGEGSVQRYLTTIDF